MSFQTDLWPDIVSDQSKDVIISPGIAQWKYPPESHSLVFIFDQSSCHCAYSGEALVVSRMNVNHAGAQPKMCDTIWNGQIQKMVGEYGKPKGIKRVLQERGINTAEMKKGDMANMLSKMSDCDSKRPKLNI